MPYTYLIGWSKLDKYYYGVRYSKYAIVGDIWITYFTSSKYVDKFRKENGEPDIIEVRKLFNSGDYVLDKQKALDWETKVFKRMNLVEDIRFLNKWGNNMVPLKLDGPWYVNTPKIQKKITETQKEKYGGRGNGSEIIYGKTIRTNITKYGEVHTLNTENVKKNREKSIELKYGTDNPFKNNEKLQEVMFERHGVTNMMFDPQIKLKHKEIMSKIDWTERNLKTKKLSLPCPFGCKGKDYLFIPGNFTKHMMKIHDWSCEQIKEHKNENKKN